MNLEIILLRRPYFHNKFPNRVGKYCTCNGISSWTSKLCPIHGATTPYTLKQAREVKQNECSR